MSTGDWLYTLSEQESRAAPVPQRLAVRVNPAAALNAFIFTTAFIVPLDKILIVKSVSLYAVAGAAQTNDHLAAWIYTDNATNALTDIFQVRPAAALQNGASFYPNDLVLMPLEAIVGIADFSAAGAANRLGVGLTGILLPKGNMQVR